MNVLIVGGGLGGLALGTALRQKNMEADIVELNAQFNVYGVGIIQQANALRALDAIGLADIAMQYGSPYGKVKLCTPTGVSFAETGTPPMGRFPSHNGISRKILHDILYKAAVDNGVHFKMGLTLESISNDAEKASVTFTDGTQKQYDLVVGADGVKSKVRQLIFGDYKKKYVGSSVWRYAFKRHANLDTGYMYFGKKSKLGLIPMTADTMYMFIVSAEGDDNPHILEEQFIPKLKEYMAEFPAAMVQDILPELTDPKGVIYRPLETLMMPAPWFKNNVVLLGDAAHATIPQLGSGAALAIEDAVVLAEVLQAGGNMNSMLENYMDRRYQRCKNLVDSSNKIADLEQLEWKGMALPEGANIPAIMGKALMELTEPI